MGVSIERILEKEIMSDKEQAACYAKADFSVSNQFFVDSLIKYSNLFIYVLDLGCGPADVCIRLAKAKRDIGILAVDASQPMLELAKDAMVNAKIKYKIKFKKEYLSDLKLIDDYDFLLPLSVAMLL